MWSLIIIVLACYLIGSLSFASYLCTWFKLPDPKASGSKNPGATNVLRIGGKKIALLVLILDVLKAFIPVMVVMIWFNIQWALLGGLSVLLGHMFPIFHHFKGGKGVAGFFGVLVAVSWLNAAIAIVIWLFTAKVLRISSIAALLSVGSTPVHIYWYTQNIYITVIFLIMGILITARHHQNIKRLLQRKEKSF